MKRHFRRWQIFHHRCVRQKWTHLDRLIGWSVTILWTRLVCIVLYLYLCLCLVVYCVCFKCHNKPQTYTVQIRLFTFFHLFHLSHSPPLFPHSHSLLFTLPALFLRSPPLSSTRIHSKFTLSAQPRRRHPEEKGRGGFV